MLSDQDFMRYSRQLLLEEIGPQGQENSVPAAYSSWGLAD